MLRLLLCESVYLCTHTHARVCEREGETPHKAVPDYLNKENIMSSFSLQLFRKLPESRMRGGFLRQRLLAFPKPIQVLVFKYMIFTHV